MWRKIIRRQTMKKNFKYFGITWIVGFIIFNAITFLIPNEMFGVTRFDKGVFWIAYGLITLSFIATLISGIITLSFSNTPNTHAGLIHFFIGTLFSLLVIIHFISRWKIFSKGIGLKNQQA
jgi:hypothetical protein